MDRENRSRKNIFLDVICDLKYNLPFNNGVFDTIILSSVLEHVAEPATLWREMARILTKGGKILMNVPFYYQLHETPYDYYRFTEYALRRFAESSGFKVILLKTTGGFPEIIADVLAKNVLFVPFIGRFLSMLIQTATYAFIKTYSGKKLSEKTGKQFPFGYFLIAEKIT